MVVTERPVLVAELLAAVTEAILELDREAGGRLRGERLLVLVLGVLELVRGLVKISELIGDVGRPRVTRVTGAVVFQRGLGFVVLSQQPVTQRQVVARRRRDFARHAVV